MTRPFDTAQQYRDRGWLGTLPLPIGKKAEPPPGYTGAGGIWPTEATMFGWLKNGQSNIAIRLPEEVVGIDVDDYDEKHGGDTLAALSERWGPLPATWTSTSREGDRSGIRLFQVTTGIEAKLGDPGLDIEIIRHGWRYIVAAPSLHPEGRRYRWVRPDGRDADDGELPSPDELPMLPAAWLEGLLGSGRKPGPRADRRERSKQARAWLDALPGGEPCRYVGTLAADLYAAARRSEGHAHDGSLLDLMALLRAGETGHPGVYNVLERAKGIFVETVGADRGGDEIARAEFDRMVVGGITKMITKPGERAGLGCDCPRATPEASTQPARLPDAFWTARPCLVHIRQAAQSRQRAPDAVLGAVLARTAAICPHTLGLPAIVGTEAGLALLVTLVSAPGTGKSNGAGIARELLPDDGLVEIPSGSGEGLVESFFETVEVTGGDGKTKKAKQQVHHNLFCYVDEGQRVTRQAAQTSSTLFSTWRSVFTGGQLGESNASAERRRILPGGSYSIGIVAAFQPEMLAPLFDDLAVGTPQRFLYFSGVDPTMPDDPPDWPGTCHVPTFDLEQRAHFYGLRRHHVDVHITVEAEIRRADLLRQRGEAGTDAWAAHRNLLRLKVAALLAILDERLLVTEDDWRLAGIVVDVSDGVRRQAESTIAAVSARREAETSTRLARRAVQTDELLESRKVVQCAEAIATKVRREPGALTRGGLRAWVGSRRRDVFGEAFDMGLDAGWFEVRDDPGQGDDKARVYPGEKRP